MTAKLAALSLSELDEARSECLSVTAKLVALSLSALDEASSECPSQQSWLQSL